MTAIASPPYKIAVDEQFGRHLIATRDIQEDELIVKRYPLLQGPKAASFCMCLGCHKRINGGYRCRRCQWPLCSQQCETNKQHKSECELFASNKFACPIQNASGGKQLGYAFIIPVRALILKQTNPDDYKELLLLQSHTENNSNAMLINWYKNVLIPMIKNLSIAKDVPSDEILRICSIFDTNAYEIRDPDGLINIRGVYPLVSLITHDCTVNTKHTFHGDGHEMHVTATRRIKKGDMISTTYTQTLWGTLARRKHLKQVKNFDCTCARCADPTEFGTYVGSMRCVRCMNGKMLSVDALNAFAEWKCDGCGELATHGSVQSFNDDLKAQILRLERRPEAFEEFLQENGQYLHDTNSHVLEVKYALIQMYGNYDGYKWDDLSDELLDRKIAYCKDLLKIADVLEPGLSRFRGNLLNEHQEALRAQAKRNLSSGKITKNEAKVVYKCCMDYLEQATVILEHEPGMNRLLQDNLSELILLMNY